MRVPHCHNWVPTEVINLFLLLNLFLLVFGVEPISFFILRVQHTLSILRYKTFAFGSYFEKTGKKMVLKMAIHRKRRKWFSGLWESAKAANLPFEFSND